jgi:NAD+ synthase
MGTTNRSEVIQGFFVKYGDGGVDAEPIAHLYKTQVYALAKWLGIPQQIMSRVPSPDTFSYEVSDKDFYFCIPYDDLDLLLYAWENRIDQKEIESLLGLTDDQIRRVFSDLERKYRASEHLRSLPPQLLKGGAE